MDSGIAVGEFAVVSSYSTIAPLHPQDRSHILTDSKKAIGCHCVISSAIIVLVSLFKEALCQKLHDFTE
ncbi:MAG: hypothetical protein ACM65L_09410 [Microcoleus sp.]